MLHGHGGLMDCTRRGHFYCPDCETYHWFVPVAPGGKTLMQVFAEDDD